MNPLTQIIKKLLAEMLSLSFDQAQCTTFSITSYTIKEFIRSIFHRFKEYITKLHLLKFAVPHNSSYWL